VWKPRCRSGVRLLVLLLGRSDVLVDLLHGGVSRIRDVPVHELGQPRMTDICRGHDVSPVPPSFFQEVPEARFQIVHAAILGKYSLECKEHFTNRLRHPRCAMGASINQVLAQNLAYWGQLGLLHPRATAHRGALAKRGRAAQRELPGLHARDHDYEGPARGEPFGRDPAVPEPPASGPSAHPATSGAGYMPNLQSRKLVTDHL